MCYLLTENEIKQYFKMIFTFMGLLYIICLCGSSSYSCYIVSVCYTAWDDSAWHFSCDGQQALSFCVAYFDSERIESPRGWNKCYVIILLLTCLGSLPLQCGSEQHLYTCCSLVTLTSLHVLIQMSVSHCSALLPPQVISCAFEWNVFWFSKAFRI